MPNGSLNDLLAARAMHHGAAQRATTYRHTELRSDALGVVGFRYAGEPFGQIALAVGRLNTRPTVAISLDPLNRAAHADAFAPARDVLVRHLAGATVAYDDDGKVASNQHPGQLVVADAATAQMLDDLSYLYRYGGAAFADPGWLQLGWELHTILGQRWIPGQACVVSVSDELTRLYRFPLATAEQGKLAVLTAVLDRPGLSEAELRDAERIATGPLGNPEEIDNRVWDLYRKASGRTAAGRVVTRQVQAAVTTAWATLRSGWGHITAITESNVARSSASYAARSWGRDAHYVRGQLPTGAVRKNAVPRLTQAGFEIANAEHHGTKIGFLQAAADPGIAASLAADGRAFYGPVVSVTETRIPSPSGRGRGRMSYDLVVAATATSPPHIGDLYTFDNVTGAVVDVTHFGGLWRVELHVDGDTGGVTRAGTFQRGHRGVWIPKPRSGPPPKYCNGPLRTHPITLAVAAP